MKDSRILPSVLSLKQDTLEATYEHVNKLYKGESGENYDNVKQFVEYNENSNVFERKFQGLIVDVLKIKEGVINCLLSDDVHLISRALKCDWFFEDAVSPDFYVNSLFPNVSYSTRCKVINRLSRKIKSEQHAEQLCQYIRHNYSSKCAEMFLPKTSTEFISAYIAENKPQFLGNKSVYLLKCIMKRSPQIVMSFLDNVFDKNYPHTYFRSHFSNLIRFIATDFPDFFIPFLEKYHSELKFFRFGKKLTKKYAPVLKKMVISPVGRALRNIIKVPILFQRFSFDEQMDYLCMIFREKQKNSNFDTLSSSIRTIFYEIEPLLRVKSPEQRFQLLEKTFLQVLNLKFEDQPKLWSPFILEMFSPDRRSSYVEKLEKMSDAELTDLELLLECEDPEREIHDMFVYLLSCEKALPKFKALMRKMPILSRREILIREMIKNCFLNDDPDGLALVLDYVLQRHKNDDPRMMSRIAMDFFGQKIKLNLNAWVNVEKLATLVLLNLKDHYTYSMLMENCIRFRVANNLDAKPQAKSVIKSLTSSTPYMQSLLNNTQAPFGREIFKLYCDEAMEVVRSGSIPEEVTENLITSLVTTMNQLNSQRRRNCLKPNEFPLLLEEIDKMVKMSKHKTHGSIWLHTLDHNSDLRRRYAIHLMQRSLVPDTIQRLLKRDPNYFVENLEKILNDLFSVYGRFQFKRCVSSRCRLDFLNVTPKIQKIASEKFKTANSTMQKTNALKMYSFFAGIEDFTALVQEYIPVGEKLNVDTDNREFVEVQMVVPQVIKNVKPDSKNLPLIARYLKGDFMLWATSSLNSASHHAPVRTVLPVLMDLFPGKPISCKKVILQRITDISLNDEKVKYFSELWDSEKHPSVRAAIFKTISKCFLENPTDEIFDIVKKFISESDEITIKERPNLTSVPTQYLNEYTIQLWKFADKMEGFRFVNNFRHVLINGFSLKTIGILSEDFCEMILKNYLFDDSARITVNGFACQYLISDPSATARKLRLIIGLMRDRKAKMKLVDAFLTEMRRLSVEHPGRFPGVFEGLLDEWPTIYSSVKLYDTYLMLLYARSLNGVLKRFNYESSHPEVAADFGRDLRQVVNKISNSDQFVAIITKTVLKFFECFKNFDDVSVADHFLGDSFGRTEALIVVGLLPQEKIDAFVSQQAGDSSGLSSVSEQFQSVMKKLSSVKDDVVRIHLNIRMGGVLD